MGIYDYTTGGVCARVCVQEAQHLEWVDDVQLFMRKGAASPMAYRMAAPLLADIATSLKVTCRGTCGRGITWNRVGFSADINV